MMAAGDCEAQARERAAKGYAAKAASAASQSENGRLESGLCSLRRQASRMRLRVP